MTAKIELISFTPDALELLIYTKESRLGEDISLLEIKKWPHEKKMETLDYMFKTIKSSFEFVDYVFHIQGVSRAFTHQLVRTRTASFQQESMRAVKKKSGADSCVVPNEDAYFQLNADCSFKAYEKMIEAGMQIQDARGILPIATATGIVVKCNLRTLGQMAEHRLCTRTQGEYQQVFKKMKAEVLAVHSWAEPLLNPYCVQYGVCCFPNYKKCPIQPHTLPYTERKREKIKKAFLLTNHQANPVAKNGRTM